MLESMSFVVALHLTAALCALGLGAGVALMRKGTARHRLLGRIWVAVMAVVAVGSFWDILQGSTNFVTWTPLLTNSVMFFDYSDSNTPALPYRFYRALLGP